MDELKISALEEQESEIVCWAHKQAESILRIGKALKTIKDGKLYTEKGYTSFAEYLENRAFESLKIGQTQGYKYISVYETYGNRLHMPPTANLDVLCELAKLPTDSLEKLEADGRIETMTTKEAQKLRKDLEAAQEQISMLTDTRQAVEDKLEGTASKLKDKDAEIARLEKQVRELESRPIEVNAKPSDKEIAKIKKQAEKEAKAAAEEAITKATDEAEKAKESYEKLIAEKTSSDERIKALEAKLQSAEKPADEKLIEFKFYFQEVQGNLKKFLNVLDKIDDAEQKEKFKGAAKKFVTAILAELEE